MTTRLEHTLSPRHAYLRRTFGDSKSARADFLSAKRREGCDPLRPRTKDGVMLGVVHARLAAPDAVEGLDAIMARPGVISAFGGWATRYGVQCAYDEVLEPGCCADTITRDRDGLRSLWQHDPMQPLGVPELVQERQATDEGDHGGLWWTSPIHDFQPWGHNAKVGVDTGTVTGLSIGFIGLEYWVDEDGNEQSKGWPVWHWTRIKLLETSLVTWAAMPGSSVIEARSAPATIETPEITPPTGEIFSHDEGLHARADAILTALSRLTARP